MWRWSLVFLVGCAGGIDDPGQFTNASALYSCDPNIDVQNQILALSCGGCHGNLEPEAGLDLVSPELGARLYGVESTTCAGEVLIDYDNILSGFLFDKLTDEQPACGQKMPLDETPLTAEELDCVRLWLAGQHPEATL